MDLAALTREEIAARLSGSPEERATFVRTAAEAGHVEAQAVFGQMLLDGIGVTPDPEEAVAWFAKAAGQQHLMALNMVGRCYDNGWGVSVDKQRAGECFRVAAERGMAWAMYNYATALALGEGMPEDRSAALRWLVKAAATGDGLARAKALNFIGSFAEDGWAGPCDMAKAADCYARAAAGGDFRACFNHARMLAARDDLDGAVHWITQAARLSHGRFRAQMREWLARSPDPLRSRGLDVC